MKIAMQREFYAQVLFRYIAKRQKGMVITIALYIRYTVQHEYLQ